MPWMGAAISAGAGLIGNMMSQSGQEQTNAMQLQMQKDMEQWQENMSDTAMQRRVMDLKQAGLNPLLAVGQGGASTPGISPVNLQNPAQAWSNLGSQMSSAAQTFQQGEAVNAQVKKAEADANYADTLADKAAGVDTDVAKQNVETSRADADLKDAMRQLAIPAQVARDNAASGMDAQSVIESQQRIRVIGPQIAQIRTATNESAARAAVDATVASLNAIEARQRAIVMPLVVQQMGTALMSANLSLPEKQSMAAYWQSAAGKLLPYQKQVESGVSTAAQAAASVGRSGMVPLTGPRQPTFSMDMNQ